jgi:hypothetical protein
VGGGHIGSSAAVMYGADVIHSRTFVDFWNGTHFYCRKWGSMRFLEGQLAQRYQRAGFRCSTYTNNIVEFSAPTRPPLKLPFYKHKNPPFDLHSRYRRNGSLPNNVTLDQRLASMVPCGVK